MSRKYFQSHLYDVAGAAIGLATAGFIVTGFFAENVSVDPNTVIGGGGLTMGGFFLHAIWRYLKRNEVIQDLQEKQIKAQLDLMEADKDHREAERSHWRMVESRLEWQTRALERLDTGRFTPVEGIPLRDIASEPGVPRR